MAFVPHGLRLPRRRHRAGEVRTLGRGPRLLQLIQQILHASLKLRILTLRKLVRAVVHLDVRIYARVFGDPLTHLAIVDPKLRRGNRPAVYERYAATNAHEPAPGSFTDQRPRFGLTEHPGEEVSARPGVLVDEQRLRPFDRARIAHVL